MRLLILAFGFLPMRRGIQITDEAALLPLHESTTDIWYADPEKAELVKLTPYGMPCAAAKEEPAYEWTYRVWKATHPRFLKLCDALLGLPWTNAQEWHPDEMKVQLLAVDQKPDQLVAWPSDWPKDGLSDSPVAGTISEFCVQVAEHPNALTAAILDPQSEAWSQNVAAEQTGRCRGSCCPTLRASTCPAPSSQLLPGRARSRGSWSLFSMNRLSGSGR